MDDFGWIQASAFGFRKYVLPRIANLASDVFFAVAVVFLERDFPSGVLLGEQVMLHASHICVQFQNELMGEKGEFRGFCYTHPVV